MRRMMLAALVAMTAFASGAAQASRILYSYVDTTGKSIVGVHDGFVTATVEAFTPANCQVDGVFCTSGAYTDLSRFAVIPIVNGSGNAVNFDQSAHNTPGTYTSNANGVDARLAVVQLADTDVVYSYVDTSGKSIVGVHNGFVAGLVEAFTPVNCEVDGVFCTSGAYTDLSRFAVIPIVNGSGNAVNFDPSARDTPGTYTSSGNGVNARLAVIGPVLAAVPEPTSWAMLTAGFGILGAALRRRRPATVIA